MSELDPATLQKIAREVESMPAEDRALVYSVIPKLAETNPSYSIPEPVIPSGDEGAAPSKAGAGLEERVRAATSAFDFTSLTAQRVVGRAMVDSEQASGVPTAGNRGKANSNINDSVKAKVSPLLLAEPSPTRPVEPAPRFAGPPSAPYSGVRGHVLMIAVCGIGLVLLSYATSSNHREEERSEARPAIRLPVMAPAAAIPNVVVDSSHPADGPSKPRPQAKVKVSPTGNRAHRTTASDYGRTPRPSSKPDKPARRRLAAPDPDYDRDVNDLLKRL